MARRRKDAEITKFLMGLPWQASMATVSIVFVARYWMIPAVLKRNPFLHLLIPLAQSMAWLALLVCACIALLSFLCVLVAGVVCFFVFVCVFFSFCLFFLFGVLFFFF